MANTWKLYILRCGDGTLYTGITSDVEKRLEAHRTGKGAKYTRGRGPLELVYREVTESHSAAAKREWQIKKLNGRKSLPSAKTGNRITPVNLEMNQNEILSGND